MNKVTNISLLNTNGMQRISITYSSVDENGIITDENKRLSRVIIDPDKLELVNQLYDFAENLIEKKEN